MSQDRDRRIRVVSPDQQLAALTLLYDDWPADERADRVAQTWNAGRRDHELLAQLWGAFEGGRLVGCIWGERMPGKTALLWGPATSGDVAREVAGDLLAGLLGGLKSADVHVVQAVLFPEDQELESLLGSHGFLPPVELLYLISTATSKAGPACAIEFEPYRDDQLARLAGVIESTYDQTRDVPQLNGARCLDDVVEGYRQTGVFRASRWFFARHDGRDAGCLLLADHPHLDQLELVYMGVLPGFRRRGLGKQLLQRALEVTESLGRRNLILAVDAANTPALQLYRNAGLVVLDRRWVSMKILRTDRF
jgi:ribosomal protein S18 acetylase RimI-like enzyme